MRRILTALCLAFIPAAIAAAADGTPPVSARDFIDLTESGRALAFSDAGPGVVQVGVLADPYLEPPAMEIRGPIGDAVILAIPSAGPGWTARAYTGPGAWRSLPLEVSASGARVTVILGRGRETVELFPPGFRPARATDYTYSDFNSYIGGLPADPALTITVLGSSVQDRPIYKIVFDDTSARMRANMKRTMVVLIRQHGDEWPCSFVLEGMLDYLLGRSGWQPDPAVTEQMRFVFYPLVNPDGVVLGQRYNANGIDLNRDWSASGPQAAQQPETFLIQSDMAALPFPNSVRVGGDHHGWPYYDDGGYRYDDGGWPASVSHPVYLESLKDTLRYTQYEPMVWDWEENGGQTGMARVALNHWKSWVIHTVEYYTGSRDENDLRTAGARYVQSMRDTAYALAFSVSKVSIGQPLPLLVDEDDQNLDPYLVETVQVMVADWITRDVERVTLTETGANTGEFVLSPGLMTGSGAPQNFDGVLQTVPGSYAVGRYIDPDLPLDRCFAGAAVRP